MPMYKIFRLVFFVAMLVLFIVSLIINRDWKIIFGIVALVGAILHDIGVKTISKILMSLALLCLFILGVISWLT